MTLHFSVYFNTKYIIGYISFGMCGMVIRPGFIYKTKLDNLLNNLVKMMLKYGHYFKK